MSGDPRVRELLEEILDSGSSPEEVCRDHPDLLPEVRDRLRRLRSVQAQLGELFPESGLASDPARTPSGAELPSVPGYEVQAILGRGGVGVVFKAWHLRLQRPVALKMLLAGACATPAERDRFLREAEAVAGLCHQNIVKVFDAGEHECRPYFTMEFVEGGTLAGKIAGTPQPAGQAAAMLTLLAEAVHFAHLGGIVHRDLKPSNVLLTADGTPKVSDFGLARRLEGAAGLTQTGTPVGTPSYMAPEQASGQSHTAGPAADVYALGAILYELLTGRPPFRAETAAETLFQVMAWDPVAPSRLNARVPRDLETICLKCLEKSPRRRYPTAAALAEDLRRFTDGRAIRARPVGRPGRVVRWARRSPGAVALIVAASLFLGLLVAAGVREWDRTVRQRAEAARWADRLAFATALQQDGRFAEARAILNEAHAGDPELDRRIAEARSRLDLVERLDGIRLERGRSPPGTGLAYEESSRRYAEAFHAAGLGEVGEDAEAVARRLNASPVRTALIAALDDWAACAGKRERDWVLGVTRRLDPDPWRDRVRDPDGWAKTDGFAALAAAAEVPRQPVSLMVAFGTRWRRLGGDPTEFLLRVQRQYPTDFWVNFELGRLLGDRDPQAAVGYLRAALAARPDAAVVHIHLGGSFLKLGRTDEAVHHYRRGVDTDPNNVADWDGYAGLCLYLGREDEYRRACRELLDRFGSDPDPQVAGQAGRACLLAPLPPGETLRAVAAVDRAVNADRAKLPDREPPYGWFAKGLAEYRQGRLERAISIMTGKAGGVPGPALRLVTAMAEYRLGRAEEARKTLAEAVASFDWHPSHADTREAWMCHALRREAERTIAAE